MTPSETAFIDQAPGDVHDVPAALATISAIAGWVMRKKPVRFTAVIASQSSNVASVNGSPV